MWIALAIWRHARGAEPGPFEAPAFGSQLGGEGGDASCVGFSP